MNLNYYISITNALLLASIVSVLIVKTAYYFKYERDWNSISFFWFSRIELKMTPYKELREWRKRQNKMTNLITLLFLLLVLAFVMKALILG